MNPPTPAARFFGLDLRQLQRDWLLALNHIANWPVLRWLTPAYVTRIKLPNGDTADYAEKTGKVLLLNPAKETRFAGFLLPDKLVLWQTMTLPTLQIDAARAAIELQVKSISPFLADDMVWAHTALTPVQNGCKTNIVIASRKIIAQHIATLTPAQPNQNNFEVWVKAPEAHDFLVLDGFGEKLRRQLSTRWRTINLCLVFLWLATAFAAAVTPTVQLRLRAIQAVQSFTSLQKLAAPALHQRELLVQLEQQMSALQTQIEQQLQPELILLAITKLLSDNTFVTSMQVQGNKILMVGQTPNTAALMQQLGSQAGVKDVRAPTATTKQRGADHETFNIEFTLDTTSVLAKP